MKLLFQKATILQLYVPIGVELNMWLIHTFWTERTGWSEGVVYHSPQQEVSGLLVV